MSIALMVIQGGLPIAALYMMKLIVDSVSIGASIERVLFLIGLAGSVGLLMVICNSASNFIGEVQTIMVSDHIQDILHAKSVEADLEYYENPKYHEILHRAQQGSISRPAQIVSGLLQAGQSCVSLFAALGLMASVNWVISLALIAVTLPSALVQVRYAKKLYLWQRKYTTKERMAWYRHWLLTSNEHAKELKLFNLGSLFIRQYRDLREEIRKERLSLVFRQSTFDLGSQAMVLIVVFGSLAYIANQVLLGSITIGSMIMCFGAVQQSQSSLSAFLTNLARLYEDNLFLIDLHEFLQLEPKVVEPLNPVKIPLPLEQGISFNHVSFGYPGSGSLVLKDVDFRVGSGQVVALVGENGSGKSTLVRLLCRLYDPQGGNICIDGINLRDYSTVDLRRNIGVVFQDYVRYCMTARENIRLGNVEAQVNDKRIYEAAERSGADEFISSLKEGYDTVLGKWFEDGTELSVGEWQKIALARAFLRDSQIIILDEPTSSLDPRAEDEVFKKFRQLAEGRLALVISHRLSTVATADYIYFLKDGIITEKGTHQKLMDLGGEYAQLFKIQAKHYR